MTEFIRVYLFKLIMVLVAMAFAGVGYQVGKAAVKFLNTAIKQEIARTVVQYVEQVYKNFHGEAKLETAMSVARSWFNSIGIKIDDVEMKTLIEAAVCSFNDGFNKGKENEAAAGMPKLETVSDMLGEMPMHPATFDDKEDSGLLEE